LSVDDVAGDSDRKKNRYHFDRHSPEYRSQFKAITEEMHARCPMAWSDTYGGHWVAAGSHEVFALARCPAVSNDHDVNNERRGYKGISIPTASRINGVRGGILEMDNPEHHLYRSVLNPYLSPAAVKRREPFIDDVTRACLEEKIEAGRIDFVDDLANVVPAVLTLAMMGIPLKNWQMYSEPTHAAVYTPEHSPDSASATSRSSPGRSPSARKPPSSTNGSQPTASRWRDARHATPLQRDVRRAAAGQPRGRPSTRWAMMLRWISEVPPAIVPAKLRA
jgi:cytochrome P450